MFLDCSFILYTIFFNHAISKSLGNYLDKRGSIHINKTTLFYIIKCDTIACSFNNFLCRHLGKKQEIHITCHLARIVSDLTAPTEKFSGATEGAKGAENGLESISVRQKLFLIRLK